MDMRSVTLTISLAGSLAWCGAVSAQEKRPAEATRSTAVRHQVAPNPDYQAGPLHRMLFGSGYRKLWATPIEVDVLDLAHFSGGLEAKKKGGGKQTKSLTLKGADGHDWKFRSIDKDPTAVLPKALQRGFVDKVVQDQISASLPANALVTDSLAVSAGLVTVPRRLVVMPDDPRLGEFRQEFAGMLGLLEEDPQIKVPVTPGFERFTEILETPELWERMDKDSGEQIDERAFLTARLFDMLIGDYDRHKDQWDFGKDRATGLWVPIPKDRDLAFVNFDGLLLDLIRPSNPRLVDFEDSYPSILGLTWQARYLDHRHLSGLEWADWEKATAELQARLTNAVIDDAVSRLPPEFQKLVGRELAQRLQQRRDRLGPAARKFYALLAREPEIHGSDESDTLEAVRREDGGIELVASGPDGPFLRRRFSPGETKEVRVFLKGGDDRAVTHGDFSPGVKLRVVGGAGNDVLDDGDSGYSRFYDTEGENRIVKGEGTKFSDRPYQHPVDRDGNADRDWGQTTGLMPWIRAGGGRGVLLGLELSQTGFGFRKHPYGHRHALRVAYSTRLQDFGGHYTYESLRTDNRGRFAIDASVSDLDLIRFHGFGNETTSLEPDAFYEVTQRQYSFAPSYRFEIDAMDVHVGPVVEFATTKLGQDSLLSRQRPYGSDDFGQVGGRLRFRIDRRDRPRAATRGVYIATEGSVYPKAWSVEETFGEVRGEAATYLTAPMPLRPTLALRAGGQRVWGRYPFHEAAFLGGADTVRGLRSERYAGDRSVYGNAELRLAFLDNRESFVSGLGVFGLADGGRVWLKSEVSDRWHHAIGGGVWLALMKPENVWSVGVASSEGRVRIYLEGGFMF